jgi:hypothetical protein
MAAITDVSVTGTKILTPGGDLVSISKIRLETIGTTQLRIYGARLKDIVGGDTPGVTTDDPTMLDKTSTVLTAVPGGFIMSVDDAKALDAAIDSLLTT